MEELVKERHRSVAHKLRSLAAFLGLLVAACGGGSSGSSGSPPAPSSTALELFDSLWEDFDATYSFFDLKGIDWADARTRFRPQLSASSTDSELFGVLSDMLLELEDPHVRLDSPVPFDEVPRRVRTGEPGPGNDCARDPHRRLCSTW